MAPNLTQLGVTGQVYPYLFLEFMLRRKKNPITDAITRMTRKSDGSSLPSILENLFQIAIGLILFEMELIASIEAVRRSPRRLVSW